MKLNDHTAIKWQRFRTCSAYNTLWYDLKKQLMNLKKILINCASVYLNFACGIKKKNYMINVIGLGKTIFFWGNIFLSTYIWNLHCVPTVLQWSKVSLLSSQNVFTIFTAGLFFFTHKKIINSIFHLSKTRSEINFGV